MKEFFNTLKRTEKATRYNLYISVILSIVGAILGILSALDVLFRWGVKSNVGALMVLMSMIVIVIMNGFFLFPMEFQQALSMGKVRKYLIQANYLLWLRNTLAALLIALGVSVVEEWLYSQLIAEAVSMYNIRSFLGNPFVFVTILLCVPALILFLGGMLLFFRSNILWGFVGVYMIMVGFVKWKEKCPDTAVLRWLGVGSEPNVVAICLLCLICGAVMLGLSWLVLRKQRVIA